MNATASIESDAKGATAVSIASRRFCIVVLVFLDAFVLITAFAVAYLLRFQNPWFPYYARYSLASYAWRACWVIPAWLVLFALYDLYNPRLLFIGTEEYIRVITACTFGIMVLIIYDFFFRREDQLSRGWLLMAWVLTTGAIGVARFAFRRLVYRLRRRGFLRTRVLVVGADNEGVAIAQQLQNTPTAGVEILGFVDDRLPPGREVLADVRVLGASDELPHLASELGAEELIISTSAVPREKLLEIVRASGLNHTPQIWLSSGLFEILTTAVQVKEVGYVPLVTVNHVRLDRVNAFLKGLLDYSLALMGLLFLWPLLLAIAIGVKLTSPGPVFHRRRVMGRGNTRFDAFKFRTMAVNADEILAQHPDLWEQYRQGFKLKDDPRVTSIGKYLRKYSLDELPQLFNVLLGQMSLVGPRMISPEEGERYNKWLLNLLTVKPGITGLWQISGRSDISYEERVRLDMHYIRNYTIWQDIYILWRTIPAVLRGRGAY